LLKGEIKRSLFGGPVPLANPLRVLARALRNWMLVVVVVVIVALRPGYVGKFNPFAAG